MDARNLVLPAIALAIAMAWAPPAQAHCDALDGPVVSAARQALDSGNVNLVLVWVQKGDEAEIRRVFQQASTVRKTGAEARNLADAYFFETLVRIHRAGEGAPYTGLKQAGTAAPPVAAGDKAIATGQLQPLGKLIADRNEKGLHEHFERVMAQKTYAPSDVEAGRAYSRAYVEFVHYAERLYDAAETLAPDAPAKTAPAHTH